MESRERVVFKLIIFTNDENARELIFTFEDGKYERYFIIEDVGENIKLYLTLKRWNQLKIKSSRVNNWFLNKEEDWWDVLADCLFIQAGSFINNKFLFMKLLYVGKCSSKNKFGIKFRISEWEGLLKYEPLIDRIFNERKFYFMNQKKNQHLSNLPMYDEVKINNIL